MAWDNQNSWTPDSEEKSEKEEALKRPGTRDYGNNVNPDNADTGQEEYTDDEDNKEDLNDGDENTNDTGRPDGSGDDEIGRQIRKQEKDGSSYQGGHMRPEE